MKALVFLRGIHLVFAAALKKLVCIIEQKVFIMLKNLK
jgi:hypothetical protein